MVLFLIWPLRRLDRLIAACRILARYAGGAAWSFLLPKKRERLFM